MERLGYAERAGMAGREAYSPYSTAMGPPLKIAMTMVPPVKLHALQFATISNQFSHPKISTTKS